MTRVLQILSSLKEGGGVQTMLKNYYSNMNLSNLQTDFIVCGEEIGGMETWFEHLDARVYHVPPRSQDIFGNLAGIRKILKDGHYDVVHCHQDYHGAAAIAMAKHYGVKKRIIHSHQAYPPEKAIQKLRRRISVHNLLHDATDFAACGVLAAKWLYGEKMLEEGHVMILHNAIHAERYAFSEKNRSRLRLELDLDKDSIVLGHIGRFSNQKNHALTIRIFEKFYQSHKNAVLLLIGEGELFPRVVEQVQQLGMEKHVRFLAIRQDVPELLSAMDIFFLPSRWEGLGIVAIESQMNGLPTVCSPYVPYETKIADNVFFVPSVAYEDTSAWCEVLESALAAGRGDYRDVVANAGYDISREAKKLEELYLEV